MNDLQFVVAVIFIWACGAFAGWMMLIRFRRWWSEREKRLTRELIERLDALIDEGKSEKPVETTPNKGVVHATTVAYRELYGDDRASSMKPKEIP